MSINLGKDGIELHLADVLSPVYRELELATTYIGIYTVESEGCPILSIRSQSYFSSQRISKYCLHFWFHLLTRLLFTQVNSDFTSDLIFRPDTSGLQVLSTGIWLRVLDISVESTKELTVDY